MKDIQARPVVQARLGSTRLPGKVLMPLGSRSVLGTILQKFEVGGFSAPIVATTRQVRDASVCRESERYGASWVTGSEEDVLERFVQATVGLSDQDLVIRLTADNPFVDLPLMVRLVAHLQGGGFDYVSSRGCALGAGVEVLRVDALREAHRHATLPRHREHVTPYVKENPDRFRLGVLEVQPDRSLYRLTIDTEADYQVALALSEALGEGVLEASQEDICQWLDRHPEIRAINQHVEQRCG